MRAYVLKNSSHTTSSSLCKKDEMTAQPVNSSCGGILVPSGAICNDKQLALSAAMGKKRDVPYQGIVESLQFKTICGSGGACFASLPCIRQIVSYCLNPAHSNINSGDIAGDVSTRSMHDYPIFYSAFCQDAIKGLIKETARKLAAHAPDAEECAKSLHDAITQFCSAYGETDKNVTPIAAYSSFLEPSSFVKARVDEAQLIESGKSIKHEPAPPSYSTWRLRGTPFETDFASKEILSEDIDVLVVGFKLSKGSIPPIFSRQTGRQNPYATEAKVMLRIKSSKYDATFMKAPNGIDYATLFNEYVGLDGTLDTNLMVVRADKESTVKIDTSNGTAPPQEVTLRPEFSGTIKTCSLSYADGEEGRVVITLENVYTNIAQFYADGNANCGCFTPFDVLVDRSGNTGTVKLPSSLTSRNTPQQQGINNPKYCRYGWNEIPSPTHNGEDYNRFGFGQFQIMLYKNYAEFGSKIVLNGNSDLTAIYKLPQSTTSLPSYFVIGAIETTGFTAPSDFLANFCACHLPSNLYASFYAFLNNAGNTDPKTECLFPGCASSDFPSLANVRLRNDPSIAKADACKKLDCTPSFRYNPITELYTTPAVGSGMECAKVLTTGPSRKYSESVAAISAILTMFIVTVIACVLLVIYRNR